MRIFRTDPVANLKERNLSAADQKRVIIVLEKQGRLYIHEGRLPFLTHYFGGGAQVISEPTAMRKKRYSRTWLDRSPIDINDPRFKLDPYWRLRAQGFSNSHANRAMRGEAIRAFPKVEGGIQELTEKYQISASDELVELGITDLAAERAKTKIVEIVVRPPTLTEEIVREAPALGYEYSISDGSVSGLSLRIRASGHKSYVLYYRLSSKSKKISIAAASDITLERARDIAREYRAVIAMGEDPAITTFAAIERRRKRREQRAYEKYRLEQIKIHESCEKRRAEQNKALSSNDSCVTL